MDPYVIAGPNRMRKTTFASVPSRVRQLPKLHPCGFDCEGDVSILARGGHCARGRLVLSEIRNIARKRVSFAFETTLSGRSYLRRIRQLRKQGYRIRIFFLWFDTLEVALSRVGERVAKGGHD